MFVSITRLHLRSARYLIPFIIYSVRSSRQARRTDGNIATDLLRDKHGAYWTRTIWRDETSMRTFMMSGAHRRAMPKLLDWCDEASLVHWDQESSVPPEWADAHRRLVTQGRKSKVRYPTAAHESLGFPPPR